MLFSAAILTNICPFLRPTIPSCNHIFNLANTIVTDFFFNLDQNFMLNHITIVDRKTKSFYCYPFIYFSYKRSAALGQFVIHRGLIISVIQVKRGSKYVTLFS